MAKKNSKSEYKKKNSPVIVSKFLGLETQYVALILYIGTSAIYFVQPSPMVPLIFWLLSLLTYQFSKDEFLSFHATQAAGLNTLAVILRFGLSFISSVLIRQNALITEAEIILQNQAQMIGWVSMGITVLLLLLQIFGAETAMRGIETKIPIVFPLGRFVTELFFGSTEIDNEKEKV